MCLVFSCFIFNLVNSISKVNFLLDLRKCYFRKYLKSYRVPYTVQALEQQALPLALPVCLPGHFSRFVMRHKLRIVGTASVTLSEPQFTNSACLCKKFLPFLRNFCCKFHNVFYCYLSNCYILLSQSFINNHLLIIT